MAAMYPIVYLPVEAKARELSARCLLAQALIRRGMSAVVGYGIAITENLASFPDGILLQKGLNKIQEALMRQAIGAGHLPMAIDEEALGISDPWFMSRDVDPRIQPLVQKLFCQSIAQRDAMVTLHGFKSSQMAITGNPRLDLLRAPFKSAITAQAEEIRRTHGRFILINTNSGSINNLRGDLDEYLDILIRIGWYNPDLPEDRALVDDHLEHDRNNQRAIIETIDLLAKSLPDVQVILRPHPSERVEFWQQKSRDHPRMAVIAHSEAAPWLLAADVMVNTGCTTGVEAAILGTLSINLIDQPAHVRHPSFFLSNKLNPVARNAGDAVAMLVEYYGGSGFLRETADRLRCENLPDNLHVEPDRFAFEAVADAITASLPDDVLSRAIPDFGIAPDTVATLRQSKWQVAWDKGGITVDEIRDRLQSAVNWADQPPEISVRPIGWGCFILQPAQQGRSH